jgi:cyclohexyl-isocyanide hydratase
LQYEAKRTKSKELETMVHHTLDKMALGGIYDHLGGGFHRYSTERTWTVPHFEKMLYDNAQLLETYAEATLFADCPRDLDVLFVPGGFGTNEAMKDQETVAFLARVGATARYVTSVCSGSLLLGVAGLLDGYRAATHWACYEALEATGAEAARARVVVDRNRITGGGVTAGIDFGLTLLAELRDEQTAKMTQLAMEYDPEPPYDTGTPTAAGPVLTAMVLAMMGDLNREAVEIAFARRSARAA